ncbi:50S ribosomal protein L25/general stress protein Ctc [uncultured Tessaracoccus sp.]|mgnify:CR=1 FL=1|uniref:50S ribosomal protein L25/general stress protein Ctc n=1 Tax=uncultured Tessaracoccus sp. TaxID=905023 RepID=UPI0025CDCC2D|nr:50S ribosomal protein L25/general stress protein Ctc [uncultured Tessaracoccus sp.]
MADVKIKAAKRTEFGKGASRRARRDGQTPAVIYGHGSDPIHLLLPAKELYLALRTANALFEMSIEGEDDPVLALPKQIQRHPILPEIEHVDFLLVKAGEKVAVEVAIIVTGEPEVGLLVNQDLNALPVLAPVSDIPEQVEVSVEDLPVGANVYVSDVKLPADVEADIELETLVASIVAPAAEEEPEEDEDAEVEETEGEESAEESEEE